MINKITSIEKRVLKTNSKIIQSMHGPWYPPSVVKNSISILKYTFEDGSIQNVIETIKGNSIIVR